MLIEQVRPRQCDHPPSIQCPHNGWEISFVLDYMSSPDIICRAVTGMLGAAETNVKLRAKLNTHKLEMPAYDKHEGKTPPESKA